MSDFARGTASLAYLIQLSEEIVEKLLIIVPRALSFLVPCKEGSCLIRLSF